MPLPKKIPKELASKSSSAGKVYANRYKVVKRLGNGTFGTVFVVEDLRANGDRKALKEISIGELKEDETFDAKREADLLAKLEHPNIVKFLDSFVVMESFCIVTEFCEGGDLTEKINAWKKAGKMFSESLIVAWLVQLLLAIQFIHKKKILHRDLKTRNIFLKNNVIKIGDFGISRVLMGTSDMATTFTGTAYYMSPEMLKHESYNSKSDIWALGVVLYELCTLDRPFDGKNLLGVMYKIVEGDNPQLPEKFHPDLRKIFNCMLNKDPSQRPSASELLISSYISSHVKDMKMKIEESHSIKLEMTKSKRLRETSSDVIGNSITSDAKKQPTHREMMKLKKQQLADAKAERLKQVTAKQFAENRREYSNIKRKQSRVSVGLPWVYEHPDVFNADVPAVNSEDVRKNEAPKFSPKQRCLCEGDVVRSSEDSPSITQDFESSEKYTNSLTAEELSFVLDPTLTNVSTIPEDVLEADVYYSQFEDEFEDDEDLSDSEGSECTDEENEHSALIDQLQAALELDAGEILDDKETIEERFSQAQRRRRIVGLKQECIKVFGEKVFERVYRYLKEVHFESEGNTDDQSILEGLSKFVDHPTDCFLVEQLLFLEKQMEISEGLE